MTTFLIAYAAVWLAVSLYVLRLGSRQRQLQQSLEILARQLDRSRFDSPEGSP